MIACNNISRAHNPVTIGEDSNAQRVICKDCGNQYVLRKDPNKGVPEKRAYALIFKRDILQGNDNLFYKYYDQYLKK